MGEQRGAFAGQISDLAVAELLRTIARGKQTGIARFDTNLGTATVWFRDGRLLDADMGRFHMEAAIARLVTVDSGTFEVEIKPISRRQLIKRPTLALVDEASPDTSDGGGGRRGRPGASWLPTAGGSGRHLADGTPTFRDTPPPSALPRPPNATSLFSTDDLDDKQPPSSVPSPQPVAQPGPARRRSTPASTPTSRRTIIMPSAAATTASVTPGAIQASPAPTPTSAPDASVGSRRKTLALLPELLSNPPLASVRGTPRKPLELLPRPLRGTPSATTLDEPSGPISVGATWRAPTPAEHPSSGPIDSGEQATAQGQIQPSTRQEDPTAAQTGRTQPPGAIELPPDAPSHDDGRRSEVRPQTDAYPKLPTPPEAAPSARRRARARASNVAQSIGLSPPPQTHAQRPPAPQATPLLAAAPASPAGWAEGTSVAAPGAAPAIVGRYEVLLRIARGGMGTVYLCRVTGEGGFRRLFALKVIRDHLSRNAEYVQMLLQEARIASRLHHPNVVGIVDIGKLANQHYLVMDYVEGCTFSELLKIHRKIRPPHLIVPLVLDALTGLHAAHTLIGDDGAPLTLVHCDFSPQNMLVGTNGICRITDFGISKAANALVEHENVTRGKPAYLSPEQVSGGKIDHRSDIFSAGAVLWNALTGEQLFRGETAEEIIGNVIHQEVPAPSTVGLRPPSCFDAICLKALRRNPDARYQSAEEMLMDLRRVAIIEDYLAPPGEVAQWVIDTFGHQLELRRQAAGISTKPLTDNNPIAIPELGLGPRSPADSATAALVHTGSDTQPEDAGSNTRMLKPQGEADDQRALPKRQRAVVLVIAATMGAAALVIGAARPNWIRGGFLDEHGVYVEDAIDLDYTVAPTPTPNKAAEPKKTAPAAGKSPTMLGIDPSPRPDLELPGPGPGQPGANPATGLELPENGPQPIEPVAVPEVEAPVEGPVPTKRPKKSHVGSEPKPTPAVVPLEPAIEPTVEPGTEPVPEPVPEPEPEPPKRAPKPIKPDPISTDPASSPPAAPPQAPSVIPEPPGS